MSAFGMLEGKCDTCLRHVHEEEESKLEEKFREYFVFTTIRNPFDRAVSSYEYILSLRSIWWRGQLTRPGCDSPSFREFCQRPYAMALQDLRHDCYTDNEKISAKVPLGEIHDFVHVEPIAPCITTSDGKYAFDYALRMDNLQNDFEDMRINHINTPARQAMGIPDLPKLYIPWARKPTKGSQALNRHAKNYKKCGQQCARGISEYYAIDFDLFGYPKDPCTDNNVSFT